MANLGSHRRVLVGMAYFRQPMRELYGWKSCSEHFHIVQTGYREWTIVHAKTGFAKQRCRSLLAARMMCGALAGLGFDWSDAGTWPKWQAAHSWLMPWFEATGQVMHRIG